MAISPKTGLTPYRMAGSAANTHGLTPYAIASGYSTAIGKGDPVKLHTDGTIIKATNGADAIGVFMGVRYVASDGSIQFKKMWTASTTGTDIEALVLDHPQATFLAKGSAAITNVIVGDIYALTLTAADAYTGVSGAVVDVSTTVAANAGLVKVVSKVDADTRALEVVLVNHSLRDDG